MTTPTPVTPSNAKAWVATIGGLIISQLPLILQFMGQLPPPYGVIATAIGSIIAAISGKAVHQVSNVPKGTIAILPTTPQPTGGSDWPQP